jgi:hypothetical protein
MEHKTYDELRAHYIAVRKRLGGIRTATGVVPPARVFREIPPPPPVVEPKKPVKNETFMLDVKLPRYRFIEMLRNIAAKHGVDPSEVLSSSRKQNLIHVKHEVQYHARYDLGMTFFQIGNLFKNDHSTVIYGIKKHKKKLEEQNLA